MAKAQERDKGEGPSNRKPQKRDRNKPYDRGGSDGSVVPGVQKVKSALRQTRRLLAKDNLAADLRVETERRLKSLEADLALAETRKKERAYALKYHKIKFFERQKVTRKIKRVKAHIDSNPSADKSSSTELENTLYEIRVDLNYILHYPKLERYISLFPPSVRRRDEDKGANDDSDDSDDSSHPHSQTSNDPTDLRRQAIRADIKKRMETGELNPSPEVDVWKAKDDPKRERKQMQAPMPKDVSSGKIARHSQDRKRKGKEASSKAAPRITGVGNDDFFDVGEEDE